MLRCAISGRESRCPASGLLLRRRAARLFCILILVTLLRVKALRSSVPWARPRGRFRFQVGSGFLKQDSGSYQTANVEQSGSPLARLGTRAFTLTNNSTSVISGTASVSGPPFIIVGTATYTLQPGQSQIFTVRFIPTGVGTGQPGYLSFTGGTGVTIQDQWIQPQAPCPGYDRWTPFDINNNPIIGAKVTASSGASATTHSDGIYDLTVQPGQCTLKASVPGQSFQQPVVPTISVVAGQNPSAPDIQLLPMPFTSCAPQNVPVVFVRGIALGPQLYVGTDSYWDNVTDFLKRELSFKYGPKDCNFVQSLTKPCINQYRTRRSLKKERER